MLFQNLAHGLLKQAECLHEEHFTLHISAVNDKLVNLHNHREGPY